MTTLKEYKAMMEGATDAPWYSHLQRIGTNKGPSCFVMISQTYGLFGSEPHALCFDDGKTVVNLGTNKVWEENQGQKWPAEENGKFIAASRNIAPELIRVIELAEEALVNAQATLRYYRLYDLEKVEKALSEIRKLKGE